MAYLIGVDIGGTKIAVSLGSLRDGVISKMVTPTLIGKTGAQQSAREIIEAIQLLTSEKHISIKKILGIGIGIPGPVDPTKEVIETSPNLPGWRLFPLRKILQAQFKKPAFLENDANAAAVGEKFFGAGKRIKNFVYITVSTGVGAGIVANGRLVQGACGSAGEFGHTTIVINGEKCGCGKRGCIETYSSGTAIAKFASRELKAGSKSSILKYCKIDGIVTGRAVSDAANAGDLVAIRVRKVAAEHLGVGIGNLINILNPEEIILGGGVLENPNYFWGPMMNSIKKEAWPIALKSCKIVRTKLSKQVGDLGAMAVVLERMEK